MLRSILVGLDGSSHSKAAVELALRWGKTFDAKVLAVAIVDEAAIRAPEPVPIGGGYFKVMKDEDELGEAHEAAERRIAEFAERCAVAGVEGDGRKLVGGACEQILCESQRCDIVLLGQQTHFHYGAQEGPCKTLASVVKASPRPVVAVPERHADGQGVVIGFDGSIHAARSVQMFQLLQLTRDVPVHVVSVDADEAVARRRVERAADFLRFHETPANIVAIASSTSPADVLLEQAERLQASLLVLGAYGKSALREFILGSITQRLLHESKVPLFLYH